MGITAPALAQDDNSGDPASDELRIETITVTATRRDQDQQTVPIAVTTVTAKQIEDAGIIDTSGLQQLAPSLVITVSNSETSGGVIRIRGIGTGGLNSGLEGAVGAFVDGIYRSRPGNTLNDLLDVAQVEVLRGPQGTLFGKNTSAGAISVTSNQPEFEFGGNALVGFGDNGHQRYQGVFTGPILEDKLAFRIAGVKNVRDGEVKDLFSGRDYNDRDRYTLRGQLLAQPVPDLSVKLIVDYTEKNEYCCAAPYILNGARSGIIESLGGTVFDPPDPDNREVSLNSAVQTDADEFGVSGHINWSLPMGELKVIASTRLFRAMRDSDVDQTDLDLLVQTDEGTKDRLNTLEATLQGEAGRLDWLVGAYAFETNFSSTGANTYGTDLGAFLQRLFPRPIQSLYVAGEGDILRRFYQTGDGFSLFTHNTFSVTDKLDLTLGLRYLEETKDGGGEFIFLESAVCTARGVPASLRVTCPVPDYEASFSDDALIYSASLSYQFTPSIMAYVTNSTGYKAGGISLNRGAGQLQSQVFDPEESINYEAGVKTEWLDGRALLNLTAFRLEFTDYQRNVFNGIETLLSNQGEVISQGIELESKFRISRGLNVNASVAYVDAQYGEDVSDAAIAGRRLNSSPMWRMQTGGSYVKRMNESVTLISSGNLTYQSAQVTGADLSPLKAQSGYALANARIGLRFQEHDADIVLWGSNLTDETYKMVTFDSVLQPGSLQSYLGSPRAWGVELTKRF